MPREARKISKSGIYHIMLRGINKQQIFNDDEDKERFIKTLKKYKAISGYKIYAYCLMNNHIHILLKVEKESLELILKRIAGSYVYWYNWKYERIGHLFQDRFKSEPVENDEYFLTVLRYIHQNPVKASICKNIADYKYSSYKEYISNKKELVDVEFAFSILEDTDFQKFNNEINEDKCLDFNEESIRMTDEKAKEAIKEISGLKEPCEFMELNATERDEYIKKFKARGISIRQISRLTGISFGLVRKT